MAVSRTVVLGANGFIARGLMQLQPCRAIGSCEIDLIDPSAVQKLRAILKPDDALVVCSALTPEHGRDRATFLKNVRMADHVVAALEESPCAHIVYISSDSAMSPAGDFYALAHFVREQILQAACGAANIPL